MRKLLTLAVAVLLVATFPLSRHPAIGNQDKPKETQTVSPKEIRVSTTDQAIPKPKDWTRSDQEAYDKILTCAKKGGASNVLLVSGDDFRWAIASTQQAYNLFSAEGAETALSPRSPNPPKKDDEKTGKPERRPGIWVVAYLGRDSSRRWSVKSVERTETRIRVSYTDHYREPGVLARPGDDQPYMLWAPLGPLEPGKYSVELFETNQKEVNLTRLVQVK